MNKKYSYKLNKVYDFKPIEMEDHIKKNTDLKICEHLIKRFVSYGDLRNEVIELEQIKRKIKKLVKEDNESYNLKQASVKYYYHYLMEKYGNQ